MVKGIQEGGEGVVEEDQVLQWLLLMQERRWLLSHPEGKPGGQLPAFDNKPLQLHRGDKLVVVAVKGGDGGEDSPRQKWVGGIVADLHHFFV